MSDNDRRFHDYQEYIVDKIGMYIDINLHEMKERIAKIERTLSVNQPTEWVVEEDGDKIIFTEKGTE